MGVDFAFVPSVLHALHHVGLERVSFLEKFVDTLGSSASDVGQSLQISRLPARASSQPFANEGCGIQPGAPVCGFPGRAGLFPGRLPAARPGFRGWPSRGRPLLRRLLLKRCSLPGWLFQRLLFGSFFLFRLCVLFLGGRTAQFTTGQACADRRAIGSGSACPRQTSMMLVGPHDC